MRAHRSRQRWRKKRFVQEKRTPIWFHLLPAWRPRHFKDETISLCHPFASREAQALSASFGSLCGQRSFAALRMTLLHRLHLTRNTSYLKCIELGASTPARASGWFYHEWSAHRGAARPCRKWVCCGASWLLNTVYMVSYFAHMGSFFLG